MSKKSLLIAAVAILVIAIIGITYLLFTEKQANRELVQEFQLDKEDLETNIVVLCKNMMNWSLRLLMTH